MATSGFRRALLGYRRAEVDLAIAERDAELRAALGEAGRATARVEELERVAGWLADRVVLRERDLREAYGELSRARAEADEAVRALALVVERLGAAPGAGDDPGDDREPEAEPRPEAESKPGPAPLSDRLEPAPDAAGPRPNGHREGAGGGRVFAGIVEVEVGPLSDFAQLAGFEDAAGAIAGAGEIAVKRFAKGRATLELELGEPVELLRELEERAPFEFRVRDTRDDRVVLDVDGE